MIGVVDYGAGNLRSVETALGYLGLEYRRAERPEVLEGAERLIFPGVGEAAAAMKTLRRRGWDRFLGAFVESGRPVLGICLGCQIVLDYSEERETPCLGLIPGRARRFSGTGGLKVPHMGWNTLSLQREPAGGGHPLFDGIPQDSSFYFVHSYYPDPDPDPDSDSEGAEALGTTVYGDSFPAAFARGNLAATQFHPEKSGPAGLRLLSNFAAWDGSWHGSWDGAGEGG